MSALLHMREFGLLLPPSVKMMTENGCSMVTLIVADWLGFITK